MFRWLQDAGSLVLAVLCMGAIILRDQRSFCIFETKRPAYTSRFVHDLGAHLLTCACHPCAGDTDGL